MQVSSRSLVGSQLCRFTAVVVTGFLLLSGVSVRAAKRDPADYLDEDYLFIHTTEYLYEAGNFSLMDLDEPWQHDINQGVLSTDAAAVCYDGLIYVINRWGYDNIQVLDPQDGFTTVRQFSVGAGSNPHDICFAGIDRAFVTRYETSELWEVDPSTGDHTDTIDLAVFADADGVPEMDGMAIHDGLLYVTVQRLDRDIYPWTPIPPSYLVVIDLADNSLIDMDPVTPGMQGIPLAAENPNALIHVDPATGDFLIAEQGLRGVRDGGIERFDPETQQSLGFIVTEETLGDDIHWWAGELGHTGCAVILTPPPTYATRVVAFDPTTGHNLGTLLTSTGYDYAHVATDPYRDQLLIADRTYQAPGLRIFDAETLEELTSNPINTGLYPNFMLVMHGSGSEVDVNLNGPQIATLRAWPQPAYGVVNMRVGRTAEDPVGLLITDLLGRPVAELGHAETGPDGPIFRWEGRDSRGEPVPTGTYWARVTSGHNTAPSRIVWIR